MSSKRWLEVLGLLAVISLLLSACGGAAVTEAPTEEPVATEAPTEEPVATEAPTEAPAAGPTGTYRVGILADIDTRNVWWMYAGAASAYNNAVMSLYYPTLYTQSVVRYDLITSVAADFATPLEQE